MATAIKKAASKAVKAILCAICHRVVEVEMAYCCPLLVVEMAQNVDVRQNGRGFRRAAQIERQKAHGVVIRC